MTMLRHTRIGLGLDAGGTGTRWVLTSGSDVLGRGEVGPISGHLLLTGSEGKVAEQLRFLADHVKEYALPEVILAGVTGTSAGSKSSRAIEQLLASIFHLPSEHVKVTTDLWVTYHACFRPGDGIVVYCGTGSAAVHVSREGKEILAGGRGHLIDDAGSGFWIGQSAMRALLRMEEEEAGKGWTTPFGLRIATEIGKGTWPCVRAYVYGGDRASLALLAPAIGAAARTDGDEIARAILLEAGRELGRLVLVMRKRVGVLPFALAGRAGALPFIADGVQETVGEKVSSKAPDAALAASLLSLDLYVSQVIT